MKIKKDFREKLLKRFEGLKISLNIPQLGVIYGFLFWDYEDDSYYLVGENDNIIWHFSKKDMGFILTDLDKILSITIK